ncbi:MAG: M23 family metallopeptidase, partial [Oligoflexia bacterium]|nr:M23 family metallopeptidase [Oligoflexia bacterium]
PILGAHSLQLGQRVELVYTPDKKFTPVANFLGLKLQLDRKNYLLLERTGEGRLVAKTYQKKLHKKLIRVNGVVEDSLYQALRENKVPSKVMTQFFDLYSFQVDFQRDIKGGDSFQILYESYFDDSGHWVETGKIHYLSLKMGSVSGEAGESSYYLLKLGGVDGESENYFNANGEGIKKSLLKTPTLAVKISSRYGNRVHPVYGHTRLHKGVDFAIPQGSPVWAAGDGVVSFSGWVPGYGRLIRIRHNSDFSTAYAHLSRFAEGLRIGSRVKQKQVIGYVGATGITTGPHLHYEVIDGNGVSVNPMEVKLPSTQRLSAADMPRLESAKSKIVEMWRSSEVYLGDDESSDSGDDGDNEDEGEKVASNY